MHWDADYLRVWVRVPSPSIIVKLVARLFFVSTMLFQEGGARSEAHFHSHMCTLPHDVRALLKVSNMQSM